MSIQSIEPIEARVYRDGTRTYVTLAGSLTNGACQAVYDFLRPLISADAPQVQLCLRDLRFLDSAGLGFLVRLNARLNLADGGMQLLHPDFEMLRLFNVAGVESALPIATSAEADRLTWELERPERLIRRWTSRDAAAA